MKMFGKTTKRLFSLSSIASLALVAALSYAQGPPPPAACSGPVCDSFGSPRVCGNFTGQCINYVCGPELCGGTTSGQKSKHKLTRWQYTCTYTQVNPDGTTMQITSPCFSSPVASDEKLNDCCGPTIIGITPVPETIGNPIAE